MLYSSKISQILPLNGTYYAFQTYLCRILALEDVEVPYHEVGVC